MTAPEARRADTAPTPHRGPDAVPVADSGCDLLALAAAAPAPVFFLERPSHGEALLGIGAVRAVEAAGPARFGEAARLVAEESTSIRAWREDGTSERTPPIWVGGFGFGDESPIAAEWRELPALRFVVPRLLWRRGQGGLHLTAYTAGDDFDETVRDLLAVLRERSTATVPARPCAGRGATLVGADDGETFLERVRAAKREIEAGGLRKVVLSRRRELRLAIGSSPWAIAARARDARPGCWTFVVRGRETSFVGSTPERLLRRRGRRVESVAIAGSAPRAAAPGEDERRGAELLACAKNALEHRFVVDAVERALRPLARRLEADPRPELVRLPEAQHLRTRIRAELAEDATLLDLAARLHPTPAVCGVPGEAALRWIAREEPARGWYAGALGWLSSEGDGDLVVALRSAVLDGDRAVLRAGAGIVAASEPELELAETEAKLAALFDTARAACAA